MSSTTGLYINNPGNIRKSSIVWEGMVTPGSSTNFVEFVSMAYGYRAMFLNIASYIDSGYNTIEKIINRWAPPSENNTSNYINNVQNWSGIDRGQVLTRNDGDEIINIVAAISKQENGVPAIISEVYAGFNLQDRIKKKV